MSLSVMAPKPKLPGSSAQGICPNGTARTMTTKRPNHNSPLYAMKHSGAYELNPKLAKRIDVELEAPNLG